MYSPRTAQYGLENGTTRTDLAVARIALQVPISAHDHGTLRKMTRAFLRTSEV